MTRKKDEENLPLIEPHPKGKKSAYAAIRASVLPKKTPEESLPTLEKNFFSVICFKQEFKKDFLLDDRPTNNIFKIFSLK